ncbi:MAG TPA: hypothetical protein VFW02_06040 [Candidatus Limnocylindrales bacterium]|nr:hypothetical protein [Candidatus Limnocylindrales bacterium]
MLALLPIGWLFGAMTAPIYPGCFEWCSLGQDLAALGFRLLGALWLLVALMVAWSWRAREPTVAAVSAVIAGPFLLLVALDVYVVPYDVIAADLVYLAWVVSLGLQLPPVWRLSWRRSPSTPLRVVVAVMNVAVLTAASAIVFLGTSVPWGAGPNVVFVCWVVFVGCLIPISAAAWRDGAAAVSLVGPLLAACLPILLVPAAIIVPGEIAYGVFLSLPLSALAWLWIATSWLREREILMFAMANSRSPTAPSDIDAR